MLETGWQPETVGALRISMTGMNMGFPNAVPACVALTDMLLNRPPDDCEQVELMPGPDSAQPLRSSTGLLTPRSCLVLRQTQPGALDHGIQGSAW